MTTGGPYSAVYTLPRDWSVVPAGVTVRVTVHDGESRNVHEVIVDVAGRDMLGVRAAVETALAGQWSIRGHWHPAVVLAGYYQCQADADPVGGQS